MSSPAAVTINASNVRDLLSPSDAEDAIQYNLDKEQSATHNIGRRVSIMKIPGLVPGNDVIYANTVSYNFEYPVVFNESKWSRIRISYMR